MEFSVTTSGTTLYMRNRKKEQNVFSSFFFVVSVSLEDLARYDKTLFSRRQNLISAPLQRLATTLVSLRAICQKWRKAEKLLSNPKKETKAPIPIWSQQTVLNAHLLIAVFSYLYHSTALSVFSPVYSDQAQKPLSSQKPTRAAQLSHVYQSEEGGKKTKDFR